MAISALGYGITVGSSYMGGALVFESVIGIDKSGQPLRTPHWTPVLPVESLRNAKPQRVEVDDVGLVPASVKITDAELVELGDQMATSIEQLRESTVHNLRVKGSKSMLRAL